VALLIWVPLSLAVFALVKKPHRAVAILLVAGAIFLPERETLTIPLLPDITKKTIACAWAFIPAFIWARQRLRRPRLGKMVWFLVGATVVIDVFRAALNGDALVFGASIVPPIPLHTAITFILDDLLVLFVPFYLGATLFNEREALKDLFKVFAIAGLSYIPFTLIEMRLSPQLHNWVYGFMQHEFAQVVRDGGYRPMVFMEHGLAVALFMATCALLATGLAKLKERIGAFPALGCAIALTVIVTLLRSFGALIFLISLAPLLWFTSPRTQIRAAAVLGTLVLLYPLLRAFDWIPTKQLVEWTGMYSMDRAGSLSFRFENEDIILHKVFERPYFGWGGFGRIFIFDYWTGGETVTFDGAWLITYAQSGVTGFIAKFALLIWPLWQAWRRQKRIRIKGDQILIGALSLTTAMVVMDLLPNGMFTYFPYLLSGALLGATRELSRPEQGVLQSAQAQSPRGVWVPRAQPTNVHVARS